MINGFNKYSAIMFLVGYWLASIIIYLFQGLPSINSFLFDLCISIIFSIGCGVLLRKEKLK